MSHYNRVFETGHNATRAAANNHTSSGISQPAVQPLQKASGDKQNEDEGLLQMYDGTVNGQRGTADIKPFQLKNHLKSGNENLSDKVYQRVVVPTGNIRPSHALSRAFNRVSKGIAAILKMKGNAALNNELRKNFGGVIDLNQVYTNFSVIRDLCNYMIGNGDAWSNSVSGSNANELDLTGYIFRDQTDDSRAATKGQGQSALITFYKDAVEGDPTALERTVVHELTHAALGGVDLAYQFQMLYKHLPEYGDKVLQNPDTYAYTYLNLIETLMHENDPVGNPLPAAVVQQPNYYNPIEQAELSVGVVERLAEMMESDFKLKTVKRFLETWRDNYDSIPVHNLKTLSIYAEYEKFAVLTFDIAPLTDDTELSKAKVTGSLTDINALIATIDEINQANLQQNGATQAQYGQYNMPITALTHRDSPQRLLERMLRTNNSKKVGVVWDGIVAMANTRGYLYTSPWNVAGTILL